MVRRRAAFTVGEPLMEFVEVWLVAEDDSGQVWKGGGGVAVRLVTAG